MNILGYRIPPAVSLLFWAALWEVAGQAKVTILLPPLSAILLKFEAVAMNETFVKALAITGNAFFAGTFLAIAIGIPIGVAMGRSVVADRLLLPWVNMFMSAPLSALVPVIMIVFGFGQTTIILTVFLFAVWIIVLDARAGVRGISPSLLEMAACFGASRRQTFFKIHIWAALPEILAGIRLGSIRAVKGVVIGQLLVSIVGFGQLFELYSTRFLMEHFWMLLLVLFAFAFVIDEALGWLQRRVEYYAASR